MKITQEWKQCPGCDRHYIQYTYHDGKLVATISHTYDCPEKPFVTEEPNAAEVLSGIGEALRDLAEGAGRLDKISMQIEAEYLSARHSHDIMHSPHEGISIIKEEYDELWDEIKKPNFDALKMRKEAIQLAAMVLAFINEVCSNE